MTLRILGKASSINVRKVLWTCAEIELSYGLEPFGIGFAETRTPEFLALNPNGLVPVIENDEGILWESNSICRYLANRHGRDDLLPTAARPRALVERWMDWQATELNTAWRTPFLALVRRDPDHADPVRIAAGIAGWNAMMGILEGQLDATGAFVAGANFTLADVVLGLSANRWLETPMPRPDYPAIAAWVNRLMQRPGFREHGRNGVP